MPTLPAPRRVDPAMACTNAGGSAVVQAVDFQRTG